ncbi:MAG TPA: hypothetical protein PLU71_02745 [Candidatus Dependentiae bacterium]|nr:hypothetical protein [Candidatus Dependentiae bacterium]HRQ62749.1 hypothetical protein [Candidatus Dependentiae bacterium]
MKARYLLSMLMLVSVAGSVVAMETGAETVDTKECTKSCRVSSCVKSLFSDTLSMITDLPSDLFTGDKALFRHPHNFATNVWSHRKAIASTLAVVYVVQHLDDLKAALGFGGDEESDEDEL